tara:strand:- start:2673 stop:2909 length:237 start_codon:yes stop_codon:yes gene_type:complete
MTTFEKLKLKVKKDTSLNLTDFKRKYPSINQRGSGAFVWVAILGNETCGSTITATQLLLQEKISIVEESSLGSVTEFI